MLLLIMPQQFLSPAVVKSVYETQNHSDIMNEYGISSLDMTEVPQHHDGVRL